MIEEIDFFGSSGPRNAQDRKERISKFVPDPSKRDNFTSYGYTYYDDESYGVGYGGYHYDGRYGSCADKMIEHYGLSLNSRVLEIGCAKGFILCEFHKKGMDVSGIDLSSYAIENAVPEVRELIVQGSCEELPWESNTFDFVYCKETLPHLKEPQLHRAFAEIKRVSKSNHIFFEIQVAENETDRKLVKAWDETHQSIQSSDWWRQLLQQHEMQVQVNFKPLF